MSSRDRAHDQDQESDVEDINEHVLREVIEEVREEAEVTEDPAKRQITAQDIPMDFKQELRQFLDLNKQIKDAKDSLKIVSEQKMNLEKNITNFMVENSIPVINTPEEKIKLFHTKTVKPLSKEFLKEIIQEYFKENINKSIEDEDVIQEVADLAFSKRPTEENAKIKIMKQSKKAKRK